MSRPEYVVRADRDLVFRIRTEAETEIVEVSIQKGTTLELYLDPNTVSGTAICYFYTNVGVVTVPYLTVEVVFTILWKRNAYNTCIRDSRPCAYLSSYQQGDTALSSRRSMSCQIGFEIGRGDCFRYQL